MKLIYVYVKIFTFPGALTKALFEQIACRMYGVPVEDNRYLRTDEMCGHVEHELIHKPVESYLFCLIPGLLNFLLAVMLGVIPFVNIFLLGNYSSLVSYYATTAAELAHEPIVSIIFDPLSEAFTKLITEQPMVVKTIDFLTPFFFAWLSISMLTNLFPRTEDAVVMKEQYGKLGEISKPLKIIFFPGYIVMRAGAILEKYSVTFVLLIAATAVLAIINPLAMIYL